MESLGVYITSFVKNLWDNKPLSQKWTSLYNTYEGLNKCEIQFKAKTKRKFVEEVNKYLPHLSDEDLGSIYDKLKDGEMDIVEIDSCDSKLKNKFIKKCDTFYFAAPPLLVKHLYHILTLDHACEIIDDKIYYYQDKFKLDNGFIARYPESFTDNHKHVYCEIKEKYPFEDKAMNYAKKHWGNILQVQPFMTGKTYIFADAPDGEGYIKARPVFDLGVMSIITDETYRNQPNFITENEEINLITASHVIRDELNYWKRVYHICTRSGSALVDERFIPSGSPIPDKVYHYLKDNEKSIREYFGVDEHIR